MIAVGVCSVLAATIPVLLISTLHVREFLTFREVNSPKWRKQLWSWRIQDCIVWLVTLSYSLFCLFFVVLFVANVDETGGTMWLKAFSIGCMKKFVIVPLILSVVLILGALCTLASKGVKQVIAQRHPPSQEVITDGEDWSI